MVSCCKRSKLAVHLLSDELMDYQRHPVLHPFRDSVKTVKTSLSINGILNLIKYNLQLLKLRAQLGFKLIIKLGVG